jgi:hypothetical protein
MAQKHDALRERVLTFYREELRGRYALSNMRRFRAFQHISDEQITVLRDYFLDHIYPPPSQRQALDDAFDRLNDMLFSPSKLRPLMGAAISSLWRMGTRLPAAVNAGKSAIEAYRDTRRLESRLVEEARAAKLSAADAKDRERMLHLLMRVPEKDVMALIDDVLRLFEALTQVEMLKVAASFLETCEATMAKRPDLYTPEDLKGIALGRAILEGGLALFDNMSVKDLQDIVRGLREVELDWYGRIKKEAAA